MVCVWFCRTAHSTQITVPASRDTSAIVVAMDSDEMGRELMQHDVASILIPLSTHMSHKGTLDNIRTEAHPSSEIQPKQSSVLVRIII